MAEKIFAFKSEEISIAFTLDYGMGDCIISKKVFDALVELAPNCLIDIFCVNDAHKTFAESFYGESKNLNLILDHGKLYRQCVEKYDLAVLVGAAFAIFLERVDAQRLRAMSPALLKSVIEINEYNKRNVYGIVPWGTALASKNILMAQILNKNCYWFLSCDGALPIRDDKVDIPLLPEYKSKFDALKLDKYITIYSNILESERDNPKSKTWSLRYWNEYIARMKKRLPQVAIVQCGGGGY